MRQQKGFLYSKQRGDGRIFQRGRVWWVAYYRGGKEYRESSDSTKQAVAERLLKRRLGEIQAEAEVGAQLGRGSLKTGYVPGGESR